ncbi:reverse transcriptase family protein [Yersinia enterocolitica]
MAKKKGRINTKGKSYSINDSALFNIQSKNKLAEVLLTNLYNIKSLLSNDNYIVFDNTNEDGKKRTIQTPSDKLNVVHTRIASLLCRITQPEYVHSGIKNKSNVSNARKHVGTHPVLTSDIRSFFPSTSKHQVFNFFNRKLKCAADVSDLMAELCTYANHIPTGSRISMPLAFWANYDMFNEMNTISNKLNITMTVYVDDITFSGNAVNRLFLHKCKRIVEKNGHVLHPKKTALYSAKEPKTITGVIVHENEIKVRNLHYKKIYFDLDAWKKTDDAIEKENLKNKVLGRMHSLSTINEKFKDKARSFRSID